MTSTPELILHWKKEFTVGVERFDTQHEKYFLFIEKLYDALRFQWHRGVIGELLGELYAYSVSHMTDEEDLLEQYEYPELIEHRQGHREFRRRIREYMDDFESGNTAIAVSVLQFLQDWMKGHLFETDRKYTEFLHSRGVR